MPTPPNGLPRILVVGGGIGGLTAAAAFGRLGADVRVVEHAPHFDPVGAGITIQANATAVLDALGIALPAEDTLPIGAVELIDRRGRVLTRGNPDQIQPDPPSVTIHRADLHRALLGACKGVPLEAGRPVRAVAAVEGGTAVEVAFEDGATERAEFVIGADGANSAVRRSIAGAGDVPLRYSGQTCWRFALDAPDLVPAIASERWCGERRVGLVPLARGRIYVYLVADAPPGTPVPGSAAPDRVREVFAGIDPALDAVLARLDGSVAIHHSDLCDREVVHFGVGRTVLLGDAAHPMTPNTGQGAGMAIEDAGALALAWMSADDRPDRLPAALDAMRRERVTGLQRVAWHVGRIAHWKNPVARALRDLLLRSTPARVTDDQARKMWQPGIDLAAEIRAALPSTGLSQG